MALFRSPVHVGGVKFRPINQGLTELAATIELPAGTVLTTSDTLRFFQVGSGVAIHELLVHCDELDTGTNTLTLNVGFLSHNTGVTASNATAYASAATIGQAGGTVRYEPLVAAPAANYTVQIVPAANANANAVGGGAKKITLTATLGPARAPVGILADYGSGNGGAYDFGRADPTV